MPENTQAWSEFMQRLGGSCAQGESPKPIIGKILALGRKHRHAASGSPRLGQFEAGV